MRSAHAHLNLTEEHFAAIAEHLKATLEELNVPADLISQAMEIAASTHDDVLNL
jgi:hemoglobin